MPARRLIPLALFMALLLALLSAMPTLLNAQPSGAARRMGPTVVEANEPAASDLLNPGFASELVASDAATCNPADAICTWPEAMQPQAGADAGTCTPIKQQLGLCQMDDGGGGGSCGPGPGGPPDACTGGGAAALPGGMGGGVQVGGGNPVNLVTGNKYQREVDLPALPGVLGLELVRHYNAQGTHRGLAGRNWRLSYEASLTDAGHQVQINQADGRRVTLARGQGATAHLCASPNAADGQVVVEQQGGQTVYRWRWPSGQVLTFGGGTGASHPLQSIRAPSGELLTLAYNAQGDLLSVRDPQGRTLRLAYSRQGLLASVQTPLSRLAYTHDTAGRLLEVTVQGLADGDAPQTRRYHYEPARQAGWAHALTGISARQAQGPWLRLSTYAYDDQGRAVLTTKGLPRGEGKDGGIEQLDLRYQALATRADWRQVQTSALGRALRLKTMPARLLRTRLTSATGQPTEVLSAIVGGHYRLLGQLGAGCATCGPANTVYDYDDQGRLLRTVAVNAQGQRHVASYQRHDAHGRLTEAGQEQAGQAIWQTRYRYRDLRFKDGSTALGQQPVTIARPSVVPGRQAQTQLTYNSQGQILTATERGWSPVDEAGAMTPTPLARTTRYTYATVAGRSVLTQLDGPLPNGPSASPVDSDITRWQWDGQGRYLQAVINPLGGTARVSHDDAGLLAEVTGRGGATDVWTHDAMGQPTQRTSRMGSQAVDGWRWQRDERGQLTQTQRLVADTWRGEQLMQYDGAGRLVTQAQPGGPLRQLRYDAEGRLLASTVAGAGMVQHEDYERDSRGRLVAVRDGTGAVHTLRGALRRTLARAQAAQASPTQVWRDDWGQVVMEHNPDAGRERRRYDAAGRLVWRQDAAGHTVALAWDVAGRLVRKTASAPGQPPQVTTYGYEGLQLTQIDDGAQREELGHDAQGRLARRAVTLKATGMTYLSTYRYRSDGTLVGQTLPDGRELVYERDGLGQVLGLRLKRSALPDWLGSGTVLASGLRRDLTGPAAITYGNGIEGLWQRSAQGVLARVVYRRPGQPSETGGLQAWFERLLPQARAQGASKAAAEPKPEAEPPIGALGLPDDPAALWDSRLVYDARGNVAVVRHSGALVRSAQAAPLQSAQSAQADPARWTHYAYDDQNQLLQAWQQDQAAGLTLAQAGKGLTPEQARIWRYLQDPLGNRLLMQGPNDRQGPLLKLGYGRSNAVVAVNAAAGETDLEAGLPGKDPLRPGRTWQWNPDGTLAAVLQDGQPLARYAYNHEGLRVGKTVGEHSSHTLYDQQRHRLADLDGQGRIVRQYVWLGDQLVALLDAEAPVQPAEATGWFGTLWRALTAASPRLGYVHANHLGAPVAVTDAQARVVWQADYAPYGERINAEAQPGKVRLDLRLPGQWADEESGLHYNDQRYYDPRLGRYISADPLGAAGGVNRFAYVENNPIGFTDPQGFTLFAFDGTGNDESDTDLISNVVRFRNIYQNDWYYITGPGTRDPRSGIENPWWKGGNTADAATSITGKERIDRLIQDLNEYSDTIDDETAIDIDVIGFSRGSAEARDFASQIAGNTTNSIYKYIVKVDGNDQERCQKVNFRFMGIWDTVLSAHTGSYSLGIPGEFAYVAHAVALNEYRGLFPVESIMPGPYSVPPQPGKVRIEKGFIGSHSDIGGSFPERDLSKVAMVWMRDQAVKAGITMQEPERTIIANPVLHDKSANIYAQGGPAPGPYGPDRLIRWRSSPEERQRKTFVDGVGYDDTTPYITYSTNPTNNISGTIKMNEYLNWLNGNGYDINMNVQ